MKKIVLFFLVVSTTLVSAQEKEKKDKLSINKGTLLLTGTLQVRKQENKFDLIDDTKTERFFLSLAPGYAVIENLIMGLNVGYSKNKTELTEDDWLFFGPYIKQYFPINSKLAFSINGSFLYGKGVVEENIQNIDLRTNDIFATRKDDREYYRFGLATDINYFLTKKIAINLSLLNLSYNSTTRGGGDTLKSEFTDFNFTTFTDNLHVGVSYFF